MKKSDLLFLITPSTVINAVNTSKDDFIYCPKCGNVLKNDWHHIFDHVEKFLLGGGNSVMMTSFGANAANEDEVICPNCKSANGKDTKFCGNCGSPLTATCPNCGASVSLDTKFCNQCGNPMKQPDKTCPGCGAEVGPDMKFCGECGTKIE